MAWRLVLLAVFAARAWACSCGGDWPSARQAWRNAPFVFLGLVELADPDQDSSQTIFQTQSVRIRVEEAFKGVSQDQIIQLQQGRTDCDAKFRTGERLVFYLVAGQVPGSYWVPWCTRSVGSAEPGSDDLLFLRGLPQSAMGTRLSGEVSLDRDSPAADSLRYRGIPGVRVRITGRRGAAREAFTNAAGAFEVFGLPAGRYSIRIEIPDGLRIRFSGSEAETQVDLAANGDATALFLLSADTRLSGRMLDAGGDPIKGVCLELLPAPDPEQRGDFGCSQANGSFAIEAMPPGDYWLIVRDKIVLDRRRQSQSVLYYPGVRDRQRAAIISIDAGKYVENLELRLPSDEKRWTISGRLRYADGVAASDGSVTFISRERGYSETTRVQPDGSFLLPVVAGMEGQLSGVVSVIEFALSSCPELMVDPIRRGMFRSITAKPVSIASDRDHDGVIVELPSPSCKARPGLR